MRRPWCGRCSGPWTSGTAAADPSRPGCRFLSCCVSLDLTERLLPLTVAALAALGFTPRPSARPPPPFRWHLPADTAERAPRGLFDSADPIEITLAADFDAVAKDRGTEKHVHAGVLSYGSPAGDTVSLNVQLHTRGHFRLRTCEFPPLKLEFDRTGAAHTPFAHQGSLKLVRSEEHTSELQSRLHLVCRLLLEK